MIKARKNILPVLKHFVLLQSSNTKRGMRTAGKSRRHFLYLHIKNRQANRLVECVSSNARMGSRLGPEQLRKPFLFNVLKLNAMNAKTQTAGKTAIKEYRNAIFTERKSVAKDIIQNTVCALIFYLDEDMNLRTYSVTEDGFETMQLQMLSSAADIARNAVEDVIDNL